MTDTTIQWTDKVWNVVRGCSRVSPGCGGAKGEGGCYAERQAARFSGKGQPYEGLVRIGKQGPRWTGEVRLIPDKLEEPLRWRKPKRIFVNSMSDLFHESLSGHDIANVFGVMETARGRGHTFQILTKRAARMRDWVTDYAAKLDYACGNGYAKRYAHVWLGVSVEDQQRADERIPDLLATPAAVRFVSYEPALGPVDFSPWLGGTHGHPKECGGLRVQGGQSGGIGDRSGGSDLESSGETRKQMDWGDAIDSVPAAAGRTGEYVSKRARDDRSQACDSPRAPTCLASLQWSDPGGSDGEPQERQKEREQSEQFGIGDAFGTDATRRANTRIQPDAEPRLSWIIIGGESGPGARPFETEWARNTIMQCEAAGVACFVKQLGRVPCVDGNPVRFDEALNGWTEGKMKDSHGGDWNEWPASFRVRQFPEVRT